MLTLAAFIAFCLSQQSCSSDRDMAEGSFDWGKTTEGGASAGINKSDFGWNIMNETHWGIGGYGTGEPGSVPGATGNESSGEKAWLPYDFAAVPAASGGWMTSNTQQLVQKGYKNDGFSVRMTYLELSQKILYNYQLADKSSLYGGLGPYIAYGIGGKSKGSGGFSESSFGGADGYKRFDAGLRIGVGYYLNNGLDFQINYDLGLTNISPAPDFTSHTRSFGFSVGYSLPKIIAAFKGKK
jgi:hypothetical protein